MIVTCGFMTTFIYAVEETQSMISHYYPHDWLHAPRKPVSTCALTAPQRLIGSLYVDGGACMCGCSVG
jgi:hypothetical protein